jgi:hypothetical protein
MLLDIRDRSALPIADAGSGGSDHVGSAELNATLGRSGSYLSGMAPNEVAV